jgi:hypothetical protein
MALNASVTFGGAGSSSTLGDGLLHYWALEETSGTRYDSIGNADLSDYHSPGYDTGKHGNCATFSYTSGDRLEGALDSDDEIDLVDGFTIVGWFYATGSSSYGGLVEMWDAPAFTWRALIQKTDSGENGFTFYCFDYGKYVVCNSVDIRNGWHLLVAWFDPSDNKLYGQIDNNAPVASSAITPPASAPMDWIRFGMANSVYYDGKADEIGLYGRVLTSDERAELWNGGAGKFNPYT